MNDPNDGSSGADKDAAEAADPPTESNADPPGRPNTHGVPIQLVVRVDQAEAGALKPWWKDPKYLTPLVAFLAIIPPATAGINGWYRVKVEEARLRHEVAIEYLKQATGPDVGQRDLETTLSFFTEVLAEDDPIRSFALARLRDVRLVPVLETRLDSVSRESEALALGGAGQLGGR